MTHLSPAAAIFTCLKLALPHISLWKCSGTHLLAKANINILNSLLTVTYSVSSPKITTSFLQVHQAVVLPFSSLLAVVIRPPKLWGKATCFFHLPGCTHHLPAATSLSQVLTILCPCHSQWQGVRKKVREGRCIHSILLSQAGHLSAQ